LAPIQVSDLSGPGIRFTNAGAETAWSA